MGGVKRHILKGVYLPKEVQSKPEGEHGIDDDKKLSIRASELQKILLQYLNSVK